MAAITQHMSAVDDGLSHHMTSQDMKSFYKNWAQNYDKDTDGYGYVGVENATDKLFQVLKENNISKNAKIMDLGAGTGKVAERLLERGYNNIDALDISPEMLEVAKGKNLYQELICECLGEGKLSIKENTYDVIISVGTFTLGHVKPKGFEEAVKICKAGGIMVFTVRNDTLKNEEFGYRTKIAELSSKKEWKVLGAEEIDYCLQFAKSDQRKSHLFVCQKL